MERLDKKTWRSWKKAARSIDLNEALCCAPIGFRNGLWASRKHLINLCTKPEMGVWVVLSHQDKLLILRIASATKKSRRRAVYHQPRNKPASAKSRRELVRYGKRIFNKFAAGMICHIRQVSMYPEAEK